MKHFIFWVTCVVLSGCSVNKPPVITDHIITQEVVVPIQACPTQVTDLEYPVRPKLAIDELTEADATNFTKVGQAYMSSVTALKQYSEQLEQIGAGVKDMCKAVNTTNNGTKQ